jgi:hypothetical protein
MSNKSERQVNSELREIQSEINILQKAFKKKQKERDDIIIDNNKYKVNGYIYIDKTDERDMYNIGFCDINRLDEFHEYTYEVENVESVKSLIKDLIGEYKCGICTTYNKTIIPIVNDKKMNSF